LKRNNSGTLNLLKFPPDFFGEDPFKVLEGRAGRKRSRDKNGENDSEKMSGDKK
jgi:hypothetical protein